MNALERAGFLAHTRTRTFSLRLAGARACIAEMRARCRRPFVSYSAGIDSTALLWLVLEADPAASARIVTWWDTRFLHGNLDECLAWWEQRFPQIDMGEVREGFLPDGQGGVTDVEYGPYHGPLSDVAWQTDEAPASASVKSRFDGVFLGLRSDESGQRALTHAYHRERGSPHALYQLRSGPRAGAWRACPLERWTRRDVAALVISHDLPLLRAYDDGPDSLGAGLNERTTLRLCDISLATGTLSKLRARDPQAFNALLRVSKKARDNS